MNVFIDVVKWDEPVIYCFYLFILIVLSDFFPPPLFVLYIYTENVYFSAPLWSVMVEERFLLLEVNLSHFVCENVFFCIAQNVHSFFLWKVCERTQLCMLHSNLVLSSQ